MCGIATLFEPTAPGWLADTVYGMTRMVRHRGPDGEGFVFYRPSDAAMTVTISDETPVGVRGLREAPAGVTLGFGHRRLSILDLSRAGHQPMSDEAGECWITFNGEIYNYAELREELAPLGHVFRTGTDTEVILASWREWGEGCLAHFNGMFAFVLFDRRSRRIFAARDRFGVKPLYTWKTPSGGLAFASEIKQFAAHPEWRARVNGQRAYDFLNWGLQDHTSETLFDGVCQLRGGEFLLASLDSIAAARPQRWYHLKPAPFTGSFADASERFRELLDDSVRLRLRADVPVGSCLSGGLDSSAIVCTVRQQLGDRAAAQQKTFSSYSDVARFDERSYVDDVTAATGASGQHVVPDAAGLLRDLDLVAWHQDEPFGSTSPYAQWCVFHLASRGGVIVMLDGQGADESLGGYHGYFGPRMAGLFRRGRWFKLWQEASAVRSLHAQPLTRQIRFAADELMPASVADLLRSLDGRTVQAPQFLDLKRLRATPGWPRRIKSDPREPVRSLGHAQLTSLNLPMLLHWEDRNSMAHSIEARLPFLDYRLVEFCLGLPEEFKIDGGWTKRVMREGLRDRLPERVRIRRDKLGFVTAEEEWMRGPGRELFTKELNSAIEAAGGILTFEARMRAQRILSGAEPFSFLVWRFISFGTWVRRFRVAV
jgi:asparagine synthase (glutamine-hydrolysing)